MTNKQNKPRAMHITLWIAQVLLTGFFINGAVMKFQPIEKIASTVPWMGQVPEGMVRLLGVIDVLGALGLILPALLRIKPQLTPWAAVASIVLMLSAVIFHVSRGEAAVIWFNIAFAIVALFVAWGRFKIVPIKER